MNPLQATQTQTAQPWPTKQHVTCKRCHAVVDLRKADKILYRGKSHIICHECMAEMEKNGVQN